MRILSSSRIVVLVFLLAAPLAQTAWGGQAPGGPGSAQAKDGARSGKVREPKASAADTGKVRAPGQALQVSPRLVEARRVYEIRVGPWAPRISVPESVDLLDVADRVRGFFGMIVILGVAVFLSDDRRAISGRVVFWGIALQWIFAIVALRLPAGVTYLGHAGKAVEAVLGCAREGAAFVFGPALADDRGPAAFVFAFQVLPTVIFVAALFAVLYYLHIMQFVVRIFAVVMAWFLGTSGAESLNVAASLFLGQTEAPLTIRPYLARLTRSELLTVMTSGMAHVSGGVMAAYIAYKVESRHILTAVLMTAPGAILLSKILVPETGKPETLGTVHAAEPATDANLLDAAARGTRDGLHLALNIAAMLIAFIGLVALVNMVLGLCGRSLQEMLGWTSTPWTLQGILGWAMAPVAYLLGVPWQDCKAIGSLLGTRVVLNELIAYGDLKQLKDVLIDRSFVIASFALCGFANISSIGIQLGGIGALVPERRHELARLGLRALLAGTLANYLSACIAGVLL
jgi:CNT family concentrative nucleoside transporter